MCLNKVLENVRYNLFVSMTWDCSLHKSLYVFMLYEKLWCRAHLFDKVMPFWRDKLKQNNMDMTKLWMISMLSTLFF